MKFKHYITQFTGVFLILFFFAACNRGERPVVPYDTDADEIFKQLPPNEEDYPERLTFGKDSIPGIYFDHEIEGPAQEVFIFFEKFTLLETNPKISQDIFNFITEELKENDFVKSSFKLAPDEFISQIQKGVSYKEATDSIFEKFKAGFDEQLATFDTVYPPFQMYFLIYPVYLSENYVTYREFASSYTGGAHGMSFSYLKTYELESGKLLTLEDIVTPHGLEDVREEVAAHMAYSYPIYENIKSVEEYIDSLNVWLDHSDPLDITGEISLKNFPLTNPALVEEGLAFIYQMYDLTPGSDGCPLVVIPYRDIRGCLYPSFEKLEQ